MDTLPPPIYVSERGSFAEYTLLHRLPHILQDVRDQNAYPTDIIANLHAFMRELSDGQVRPLEDESADAAFWRQAWIPFQGRNWHQLPWFFAETYFYRRILEAVQYFGQGSWQGYDPFSVAKKQGLDEGIARIATLLHKARELDTRYSSFQFWLFQSLWSNRSDFSNQMALSHSQSMKSADNDGLLVDDSLMVWNALQSGEVERLDFVCDNAGPELLTDLAFADMLLTQQIVSRVVLHVKAQPYYVSDSMIQDVDISVRTLQSSTDKLVCSLGTRLGNELQDGRLSCHAHPFWTSCLCLFQIPTDLLQDMAQAQLVVFKGDVNYRRLLDDRHWSPATPLAFIPNQVPGNYVVLRTVKSELICGLADNQHAQMTRLDPDWLINGRWGLIQYVAK